MKKFKFIKSVFCLSVLAIGFTGCEESLDPEFSSQSFVGFESVTEFAVERNTMDTRDVIVATNNVSGADRTFNLLVDMDETNLAAEYSVPSTVTIPANSNTGTFTITVTDDDMLSFEAQRLVISLGQEAGLNVGETIEIDVVELCEATFVTLKLDFDAYAEECSFEIYDLSGSPTIIYTGGESGAFTASDNESLSFEYCLTSGDYGIVVYDSYGDGGTTYTVFPTADESNVLATGTTPGGNPANVQTLISDTFTID